MRTDRFEDARRRLDDAMPFYAAQLKEAQRGFQANIGKARAHLVEAERAHGGQLEAEMEEARAGLDEAERVYRALLDEAQREFGADIEKAQADLAEAERAATRARRGGEGASSEE